MFEQLAELFANYIYNNTDSVHTNTLYTLLITITRPVHTLPKASRVSDQLSDRLIFGQLFQAIERFFGSSIFHQLVDPLGYCLQSKDELVAVKLRGTMD